MESFELLCGPTQIVVEVHGYERAAATDPSDANWLTCHLSFRSESVSSELDCSLTTSELKAFDRDLTLTLENLESELTFQAYEEGLSLRFVPNKHGQFKIAGSLRDYRSAKVVVSFELTCGLDVVASFHAGLRRVLRAFPVRALGVTPG